MFTHRLLKFSEIGSLLFAIVLFGSSASALEPPDASEIAQLQSTNQLAPRIEQARQIGNHRIDSVLLNNAIARTARLELQKQGKSESEIQGILGNMAPPPDWRGMPTIGNVKVLTLLIAFNDYPAKTSSSVIHSNLFGTGNLARAPYESLATYYKRASYNKLNLGVGTTLGWFQAGVNRSSIPQTTAGREALIKKALDYYNAKGHDFKQYDNNGDGVIDYLVVIWTGPDNGWANFWWGYQTRYSNTAYKLDGVSLGKYSWQWEARPVGSAFTPLVVIHETGHGLGLPDYYDYDDSIGPKGGVGGLDMMDHNMGDHNCFSKWVLDWLTPKVIATGTQAVTLAPSGTTPTQSCVAIWPSMTSSKLFSEFFVAQNRYKVGNDNTSQMPTNGMLVWHVDARLNATGRDYLYDNSYTSHKLLRLMEADGLEEIEQNKGANAGDYYIAGKTFGPTTKPSSYKYDGTSSGVGVTNITSSNPNMSASFSVTTPPPVTGFDSQFTTNASGWTAVNGAWAVANGFYSSIGLSGKSVSSVQSGTYTNMTYEVRMKRTGTCTACANRILFRGTPSPLGSTGNWNSAFMFQYSNSGSVSIYAIIGGSVYALMPWRTSAAIVKSGLNTLKVTANTNGYVEFYINGVRQAYGNIFTHLPSGRVGLGFYRDANAGTVSIDWAKLVTSAPASVARTDNAIQIRAAAPVNVLSVQGEMSPVALDMAP